MARLGTITNTAAYTSFGVFGGVSFWPGSLTIVAATPGMGKTSWGLAMVAEASQEGLGSALACYEHTEEELADRLRRQAAGKIYGAHPQQEDDLHTAEVEALLAAQGNAILLAVEYDETARALEDRLIHVEAFPKTGPALLVVDYLQRMPVVNRLGQMITDNTRAGEAAVALKAIAKKRGWAIVAISALEKETFTAHDIEALQRNPESALAYLLGDERVSYEADRVFVLYRTETLSCGCCHKGICVTAKNRNGRTEIVPFTFWGQRTYPFLGDAP